MVVENQVAGLEKRVLAPVPRPHPMLCKNNSSPYRLYHTIPNSPWGIPESHHLKASEVDPLKLPELCKILSLRLQHHTLTLPEHLADLKVGGQTLKDALVAKEQDALLLWDPQVHEILHIGPINSAENDRPNPSHPAWSKRQLPSLVREFLALPEMSWLKDLQPLPFEKWVVRFPERRRTELREARDWVLQHGINESDATLQVFMKMESSTTGTDPRNISPRSARFLSIFGPYMAAVEKAAIDAPFLVKGLSPAKRAEILSQYAGVSAIETDFSRFDMTVSEEMIHHFERKWIDHAFCLKNHPDFAACVSMLSLMKGNSTLGVGYAVRGTRASGDAHTSIANGLLNYFVIWVCLRNLPATWKSWHEGDDGRISCPTHLLPQAVDNLRFAAILGFKLKVVVHLDPSQAVFCGRRVCECGLEQADVPRALAKFHTTVKEGDEMSLVLAKAYSYRFTDGATPIIGTLCQALIDNLEGKVNPRKLRRRIACLRGFERGRIVLGQRTVTKPPAPCCRALLAVATGWSVALQIAFETELSAWADVITNVEPLATDTTLCSTPDMILYD